jgi:hypothetical protein
MPQTQLTDYKLLELKKLCILTISSMERNHSTEFSTKKGGGAIRRPLPF